MEESKIVHYRVATLEEIDTKWNRPLINIPMRWVYCQYCKYRVLTTMPAPHCVKCDSYLIESPKDEQLA